MGGGDLNLKKSWHPSTLRNIERVWKAEQKHEAEQQKIEQLQKELAAERAREEIQSYAEDKGVVKKKDERLEWMYQGPAALVNREEYLLGRKIDKSLELLQTQESGREPSKREEDQARSIFHPEASASDFTVDLENKIKEDPLFMIMKREKEQRKDLLNNPVRMKQLQAMLKLSMQKKKKKSKSKKKKSKKAKHETDSSNDSEEEPHHKKRKERSSKRKNGTSSQDLHECRDTYNEKEHKKRRHEDSEDQYVDKYNYKYKNRKESQEYSELSEERSHRSPQRHSELFEEQSRRGPQRHSELFEERRHRSPQRRSELLEEQSRKSPQGHSGSYEKEKYGNHRYQDKHKSVGNKAYKEEEEEEWKSNRKHDITDELKSYGNHKHKEEYKSSKNRNYESKEKFSGNHSYREEQYKPNRNRNYENEQQFSRNHSYRDEYKSNRNHSSKDEQKFDRNYKEDLKSSRNHRCDDEHKSSRNLNAKDESRPVTKKKLSEDEKAKLREEMMANADWRDKQRQKNVKRYIEEGKKDDKVEKGSPADFIMPMLSKAAERGTVEERVRQKIFTIQRKKSDMHSNFAKR